MSDTAEDRLRRNLFALMHETTDPEGQPWTYKSIAVAMGEAGCPVHLTAVAKTIKGDRRVTVDELIAYTQVFGVSAADLTDDRNTVHRRKAMKAINEGPSLWYQAKKAEGDALNAVSIASSALPKFHEVQAKAKRELDQATRTLAALDVEPGTDAADVEDEMALRALARHEFFSLVLNVD